MEKRNNYIQISRLFIENKNIAIFQTNIEIVKHNNELELIINLYKVALIDNVINNKKGRQPEIQKLKMYLTTY